MKIHSCVRHLSHVPLDSLSQFRDSLILFRGADVSIPGTLETSHIDDEKALRLHKLAVERAAKKQFGQRMIDGHTKANQQVKQLGESVDLPQGMTALTGSKGNDDAHDRGYSSTAADPRRGGRAHCCPPLSDPLGIRTSGPCDHTVIAKHTRSQGFLQRLRAEPPDMLGEEGCLWWASGSDMVNIS